MNVFEKWINRLFCNHDQWIPIHPQPKTSMLGKWWNCVSCGKKEFVLSGEERKYCFYNYKDSRTN